MSGFVSDSIHLLNATSGCTDHSFMFHCLPTKSSNNSYKCIWQLQTLKQWQRQILNVSASVTWYLNYHKCATHPSVEPSLTQCIYLPKKKCDHDIKQHRLISFADNGRRTYYGWHCPVSDIPEFVAFFCILRLFLLFRV